jgi:hypothetical protein
MQKSKPDLAAMGCSGRGGLKREGPLAPGVVLDVAVGAALLERFFGQFADGYTPEDVDRVCSAVRDATGVEICVVWDYFDDCGFGGNSDFAVAGGGKVFGCSGMGGMSGFLSGEGSCPSSLRLILEAEITCRTESNYNYARVDKAVAD